MRRFLGKISDEGKFNPNLIQDMKDYLKTLIGKDIEIRVGIKSRGRTTPQNSLYWKWLDVLEQETGQPRDDFHMFFRSKFLSDKGVLIAHFRSTTELDTVEFIEYMNEIEDWVRYNISQDFQLPNPGDLYT